MQRFISYVFNELYSVLFRILDICLYTFLNHFILTVAMQILDASITNHSVLEEAKSAKILNKLK